MYSLPNESISVYLFFVFFCRLCRISSRLICGSKSYINNKGLPHSQSGAMSGTLRIINRKDSLQTWFDFNLLRLWFELYLFFFSFFSIECSLWDQCFIVYAFLYQAVYLILSDFCVIHIHKLSLSSGVSEPISSNLF